MTRPAGILDLEDSEPQALSAVPQPTSRALWVAAYVTAATLVVARSTSLRQAVLEEFRHSEAASMVSDQNLESLAVNVGIYLGILLSLGVVLLYFALAATAERHIFTRSLIIGRWRIGLFFTVAMLCTVPVHAVAWVAGLSAPRDHPLFHAYVVVVVVGSLLLFRRRWADVGRSRLLLLVGMTLAVAILSVGA